MAWMFLRTLALRPAYQFNAVSAAEVAGQVWIVRTSRPRPAVTAPFGHVTSTCEAPAMPLRPQILNPELCPHPAEIIGSEWVAVGLVGGGPLLQMLQPFH